MLTYKRRIGILIFITVFSIIGVLSFGRIPQHPSYHLFADTREIAGIRNCLNVLSNILFLLVALYGLRQRSFLKKSKADNSYTVFCIGVFFVSLGSAYYHYAPSTSSLFWDRLPMTVAFMALFSMLLDERVMPDSKSRTLWPLLAAGAGAVIYWYRTETQGFGDLRPYVLVQFLPMVLMPAILLLFKSKYLNNSLLWSALALYSVAKAVEHFDRQVFELTGIISGHTFKHILASIAVLCIILAALIKKNRRRLAR